MDKIIEEKICSDCEKIFSITQEDIDYLDKIIPHFGQEVYQFPLANSCPDCRQQKRLSFFNERNLYKRQSDFSGKNIISTYSPDKEVKVFDQTEWWGEWFSGLNYWRIYKNQKDFFEQFSQLLKEVPLLSLVQVNCDNSEFNNFLENSKNCYLCISNQALQDCQYVTASNGVKSSQEVWWSGNCENSYEIFNCANMYHSFFCSGCTDGTNLIFCEECNFSQDCAFCYGLNNQKYHIFNKPYTKEEYEKKMAEFTFWTHESIEKYKLLFEKFIELLPHQFAHQFRNEMCSWDYLYGNKSCSNAFSVIETENARYFFEGGRVKNIYDCSNFYDGEGSSIWSIGVNHGTKVFFSANITLSSDIYYSTHLYSCKFCFGCTWLKNQEYCILNKKYSKEEYFKIVQGIVEKMIEKDEWGEFFPKALSQFGYNETVAQEYFPLTKDEAIHRGYAWSDYIPPNPKVDKIIPWTKLPWDITSIPDDVLNWAIECEVTKKLFRINVLELEFYRKHKLPPPRRHPETRHLDRIKKRNPRTLCNRKCYNCQKEIRTSYAPKRPEKLFCEICYLEEVFS